MLWLVPLQGLFLLGTPQLLTLAEAHRLAEQRGPDLVEARTAIPIAQAGVETAGQWPNPSLVLSAGPDEPTLSAGLDQRFPIFGQKGASVEAARADVRVARASFELKRIQVDAAVRRTYFALAQAQQEVKLIDERVVRAKRVLDVTQQKFDLGTASQLDVEQATLAHKRAQQAAQDQELRVETARVNLAAAVGWVEPNGLEAADPLLPLPAVPSLSTVLTRIDTHPEIELLNQTVQAARARAHREAASIRPAPDLALTAEKLQGCYEGTVLCKVPQDTQGAVPGNYSLGVRATLSFELPVLSQNRGPVHQAQREAEQAEALAEVARRRRSAQARLAHANLAAAVRRSEFLEGVVVPQALHVETLARLAYQAGRAPLVSVLQAESEVTDVQAEAVAAAAAAQTAYADVEEAMGAPL
jgi:cobalt-zinc-cadmium efflux system outer membrane protein